jgi:histidinol-phosphate aminotransferase
MIRIPKNVENLQPYKPGKPSDNLFSEGLKPVFLASNENNFGPSPMAVEAIQLAASSLHLYPDPTAMELRRALAQRIGRGVEEIVASNGSDELLYVLFRAFFEAGDELLTSENTFISAKINASIHGVTYKSVPMREDYSFDLEKIYAEIGEKTKVIYLVNPNNPTGQIITREALESFLSKVPKRIIVVVDEAYYEMACDLSPDFPDSTEYKLENVITLRSFSKVYGLGGLRLGYAVGPARLIEALMKVRPIFSPSKVAQAGGIGALKDEEYVRKTVTNNTSEMQKYADFYKEMGLSAVPSYGNFTMIDLKEESAVEALFSHLMSQGILVRRLASFGLPHAVRISIGRPEENDRCRSAMRTFFNQS